VEADPEVVKFKELIAATDLKMKICLKSSMVVALAEKAANSRASYLFKAKAKAQQLLHLIAGSTGSRSAFTKVDAATGSSPLQALKEGVAKSVSVAVNEIAITSFEPSAADASKLDVELLISTTNMDSAKNELKKGLNIAGLSVVVSEDFESLPAITPAKAAALKGEREKKLEEAKSAAKTGATAHHADAPVASKPAPEPVPAPAPAVASAKEQQQAIAAPTNKTVGVKAHTFNSKFVEQQHKLHSF
jgi:hypothetical protein